MGLFKKKKFKGFPGRVHVHVVIDGKLRNLTIGTEDLRQIRLFDRDISCLDRIHHISFTKNMIILQKSSPLYRYSIADPDPNYVPDYSVYNYVDAYDYDGNHLWNIAEILGDIGCGVHSGQVCAPDWLIENSRES